MRKTALALLALLLLTSASSPQYEALRAEAERFYEEKSYSRANELYRQAAKLVLDPAEKRWVELRIADTTLRADAAAPDRDPAARDAAVLVLRTILGGEERDRVWAEANESLADYLAFHPRQRSMHGAAQHYLEALDWWGGSDDIPLARKRYLDIVWRVSREQPHVLPRQIYVNAIAIAESRNDRARARFLLATQLTNERTPESLERAAELYEEIIADRGNDWYWEALFAYASQLDQQQEYGRALELYRRLIAEAGPQTRNVDNARRAIESITAPAVNVAVGSTFLPGAEQEYLLSWRNTTQVELSLIRIDLTKDVHLDRRRDWIETMSTEDRPAVRRWTYDTNDKGEHLPGSERLKLNPRVEPGAYILTARTASKSSRQLLLVSDTHVLLHSSARSARVLISNVVTGEPIAGAEVNVYYTSNNNETRRVTARTGSDGVAAVSGEGVLSLVTASAGESRQAFHRLWLRHHRQQTAPQWRVYAFTDRPAYRPGESVQWKVIARIRDGESWRTPDGQALEYEIRGPRDEKVASGTAKLNAFGSFWSELALTPSMALGEYVIHFKDGSRQAGSATLFRLEEYKLPEFSVSVSTPEGKQYRLGDTIEATIDARYYFGGPVANAEVEAVVYSQPYYRHWYPWREYDWYWHDSMPYAPQSVVTTETLRTDAEGRAVLRIPTPRDGSDTQYRIEARVVDASRREVRGEGSVRVMRQRYSVMARPEHFVHRPGDSVSVVFKAMDANDKPVQTTGDVKVVKRTWTKCPPRPLGARGRIAPCRDQYRDQEILATKLATNAEGEATLRFTPKSAGYYAVLWTSIDGDGRSARDTVTAETALWVADSASRDLGYFLGGGVEIILDRESYRSGETANAIVVTPASGRWVMLSTSGDDILDTRVLHLDGTVQLVQIELDDRHVPNFFITASSVFDRQIGSDSERVVVPPVEHFLDVEVKSDREQYEPRQQGTLTITTKNSEGRGVPAEVAVALSDEAVTAIQKDPAGDPRQFFFGDLRHQTLQVSGGLQAQRYVSAEDQEEEAEQEEDARDAGGVRREKAVGGIVGGVVGGVANAQSAAYDMAARAPMPVPPPAPTAVAEAITVTAESAAMPGIEVTVRSDFRSTALWKPDVVTGADGTATLSFTMPEALTTWRATARAATTADSFGIGTSTSRTSLPLLVRLQSPRFLVVGDRALVSAVINNNTDEAITVTPELVAEGVSGGGAAAPVRVEANADARVDWEVSAAAAGEAKLRVSARGTALGDAMEKTIPVYEHGIDKLIARSGKLRGSEALVRLELPAERRSTQLVVQVAPSLAATMLDALPFLIEFPYGCTEQTMSRFLPAVVVARTLERLGLDPEGRLPKKKLDAVTAAGLARLYDMQHDDGAWGWWKEGASDRYMTAYVLWGFALARQAGLDVRTASIDRAADWLERQVLEERSQWNDLAWMLHALSSWRAKPSAAERNAFEEVWKNRERLSAYSRALFALTAHRYGDAEKTKVLVRNLEDGVKVDRTPDQSVLLQGETAAETMATAYWGSGERFWWRWHEGPVESTAFVLQALSTIEPGHRLVEPAMNWLVKNRRGAQWNNTKDTAIALLAMNDYLEKSGELKGDVGYELSVNGQVIATKTLTPADVVRAPSRFTIDAAALGDTTQEIRIRRTSGSGPIYFAAEARFFSLEEPVKPAGNEIFVRREYFRLVPKPTLLKGVLYDRVPLRAGETIASGDRIEVVATIDAKNDYDYLVFEDLKPAGLEAVELQSGEPLYATSLGRSTWVYQELRDRKVAMFVDHLEQGMWEIRYTLRAETPGTFHALPLIGQAMYVPEVRGNSAEVMVGVRERGGAGLRIED